MTTSELIQVLATYPADHPVIMAKDGEGNGFSPLSGAEDAFYLAYSTWSGDRTEHEWGQVPAVFLWPVN